MILQFCRCGGGSNAKGHPDGFPSHFPSLRNFQLSVILTICVPPFLLYRKTPQSTTGKQKVVPDARVVEGRGQPGPALHLRKKQAVSKTVNAEGLSLRGGRRPTRQSREGTHDFADGFPVIQLGAARLPRRFAPRNDTSGKREVHQRPPAVKCPCTRRSLPVKGTPHP